jgi:hypothetical protein
MPWTIICQPYRLFNQCEFVKFVSKFSVLDTASEETTPILAIDLNSTGLCGDRSIP